MFALLKKFWFTFLFVFLAAISIGVLFGYRFSLKDSKLEQRGVLFLDGEEKNITLQLDDQIHQITLPYLDTNITSGKHRITLEKKGYQPYVESIDILLEKATHLKIDFAPLATSLVKQSYTDSDKIIHFFLNNKYFVEYYKETNVISFFQEPRSIQLHKPDKVQTIKFLEPNEEIIAFESFKNEQYLLHSTAHWRLCTMSTLSSCTIIEGSSKDTLISEQEVLLRIPDGESKMYIVDENSGQSSKILIENTPTKTTRINKESMTSEFNYVIGHTTSSGSLLKKNIFAYTSLLEIAPLPESLQWFENDYYIRTATGGLFTASEKKQVATNITGLYTNRDTLYVTTQKNTVESMGEGAKSMKELTEFKYAPEKIIFSAAKHYAYVLFPNGISYCDAETFHYCFPLSELPPHIQTEYQTTHKYFIVRSKEETFQRWNFIFLPDSKDNS